MSSSRNNHALAVTRELREELAAAEATATLPPQDLSLEEAMSLVRELAETGRRIRVDAGRRQRLPCGDGWIVSGPDLSQFHEICGICIMKVPGRPRGGSGRRHPTRYWRA